MILAFWSAFLLLRGTKKATDENLAVGRVKFGLHSGHSKGGDLLFRLRRERFACLLLQQIFFSWLAPDLLAPQVGEAVS